MNKNKQRIKYKKLRESLSDTERDELSIRIANQTLRLPIWNKIYYHLFLSIHKHQEIDTEFLLQILQGRDKSVVISKSDFQTGEMTHFLLQENTRIVISSFGIPEPVEGLEVAVSQIDVVFVPLLAFDKQGHRIGYGKGFYDRFLSQCKPDAIFVGLSFFDAEEHIQAESTDIPLHFCVTPDKIYDFNKP